MIATGSGWNLLRAGFNVQSSLICCVLRHAAHLMALCSSSDGFVQSSGGFSLTEESLLTFSWFSHGFVRGVRKIRGCATQCFCFNFVVK